MQTLAHSLTTGLVKRGLVITPKPQKTILGGLRDSIRAELRVQEVPSEHITARTREALERVMLSCVFDLDGLWEVLAELDKPATPEAEEQQEKAAEVEEIQDSQDEDDDELFTQPPKPAAQRRTPPEQILPDIIVITHFSTLLTSLFTHREKSFAHSTLQLLGSHLRYLTRTLLSTPLILILNSTTTSGSTSNTTERHEPPKPLDQTLRSIFNPPPLPIPGYIAPPSTRRNKPSFGLVFSQLLDVHLLCTRIPRGKEDAEAAVEGMPARYVWVVECLLDEVGVWEGNMGSRRRREERWAGVDIQGGRVVDGVGKRERNTGDVTVAGGFGGRRV